MAIYNETNVTLNLNESVESSGRPRAMIFDFGMISRETNDLVTIIVDYISIPLLSISVIFNVFNIAVYKQKSNESSKTYIIGRAALQLAYGLLTLISDVMALIYGTKASATYNYLVYHSYVSRVFTISVRRSAFFLTFVVTFQRFLALAFPLRFRQFKFSRFPAIFSFCVVLITIILHIPQGTKFRIKQLSNNETMSNEYRYVKWSFYAENEHIFNSFNLFTYTVTAYFPLFACLLLDIFTIIALRLQSRQRPDDMRTKVLLQRERQMTIIILLSSFVFVLLAIPLNVNNIFSMIYDDYGLFTREHYLFIMMFDIGYVCDVLGNCTDFLIYFGLSSSYRQTLNKIFTDCCCAKCSDESKKITQETDISTINTD